MGHLAYEMVRFVSHIYRAIVWIENARLLDGTFRLEDKKVLQNSDSPYRAVAIDATEHPVECPPKNQENWYSGKKKQHTIKTQLIIFLVTLTIIGLAQAEGKVHDFQ
ncbi:MAG: hypothetical protein LBG58_06165 [Planctomycetaceae bacterium]|jgi:uncharacterized membrane protein|nr:hypothetical protein [Planctomycetaceae bacterium]